MLSRRGLITGLISFAAAPAIVKIENIMPVKSMIPNTTLNINDFLNLQLRHIKLEVNDFVTFTNFNELSGTFKITKILPDDYYDFARTISC